MKITFAEEPFQALLDEGSYLFPLHYEELALNKDKCELGLFTEKYLEAERIGMLCNVIARDKGKVVGYYVAGIMPHLHYRNAGMMASTDMYFLHPVCRNSRVGIEFLRFIEKTLKQKGITKMYISCKVHEDKTSLFEFLGFNFTDKMFTKVLE